MDGGAADSVDVSVAAGPSRAPQVLLGSPNLLTAALLAAQDVESVTACRFVVGTYMACSCDGVGVRCTLRKAKH